MYNIHRGVEQLEARRAHNPEVVGSSPTPATTKSTSNDVLFSSFKIISFLFFVQATHFNIQENARYIYRKA